MIWNGEEQVFGPLKLVPVHQQIADIRGAAPVFEQEARDQAQVDVFLLKVLARCDPLQRPKCATMDVAREAHVLCSARQRRDRRVRAWWSHEQFAFRCTVTTANHHSSSKKVACVDQCTLAVSLVVHKHHSPRALLFYRQFKQTSLRLLLRLTSTCPTVRTIRTNLHLQ